MMAAVSELAMYQATALQLQREKTKREAALADGRTRLARLEPPSEEAEKEWLRRARVLACSDSSASLSAEHPALPEGVLRTTAPPRPSAYIPDELGIPKPYGAAAPFKPQELGSTFKQHMRVPQPRQIEI